MHSPAPDGDARLPERLSSAGRALVAGGGADRVAEALRDLVADGALVPGTRLPEDATSASLGVSRNTLREAFRLLVREGLLRHELHRGVFVRSLTAADVVDVYRFRRVLEFAAIDGPHEPSALQRAREAVEEGRTSRRAGDWEGVGTANNHFHSAVVALAGSPRMDDSMRHLLAELRLAFVVVTDPRPFHEPYLEDNGRIADHLEAGERGRAGRLLAAYLDRAEGQLLAAHR
ncbi:GntR family transcriptional regulator [Kineococcus radiotolerans]|uniref:Transcriptional regulator, GntR family n=1 Tax=Kineococcus radiotolerans (strain ATCC BAA-149 / DSM 14245 / SRS30216) TaxID=266940 RepID=A6WBG4_KINRD|nr:GntR family transcriptional regulator [Kineococcus radiotolerans]ABS04153.1 transcriptional regulator, GntR family [Kineococcus radiotolerans SRS30216 = ATCC BAA-149]